jgi:hypothetical protein
VEHKDLTIKDHLKELDDNFQSRTPIKIGVLYVNTEQNTQKDILFNDSGSELYNDFLRKLG